MYLNLTSACSYLAVFTALDFISHMMQNGHAQRNENKIDWRKQTYYHNRRLSPRIKKYKVQYTSD
ncbi:hypothetical protein OUZ56_018910 [Daphnia magna]|uniref:Uncharacterized protein n=1 Tax=Daphnia magna TaxID=35525 RepID=A0ABQ9ZA33_9CRUS|nr:hypothetical protein OUZ56_018910 [Daphnia magna]